MTPEQTDAHTQAADAVHAQQPIDAKYVRGARPGRRILTILVISLAAVAVLLLGMWFLSNGGFASQNGNSGGQPVDSQAFSADVTRPPAANGPTAPST